MAKTKNGGLIDIANSEKHPTKTILFLTWPVLIEQIMSTLVSFADTAMVGALGKQATAAVSISNTPTMLINAVIMALGIGITALIARSVGAKEYDKTRILMRHAILVILFVGIPICILLLSLCRAIPAMMGAGDDIIDAATEYNLIVGCGRIFMMTTMILSSAFRGYGDTRTPLVINAAMNVINVVFNYFLINKTRLVTILGFTMTMPGAGWGVNGAAAATAISMFVGGASAIVIAFTRNNEFKLSLKDDYSPNWPLIKQIVGISFPSMLERMCINGAGIAVTSSIATLGTTAVAANSLYMTAESMLFMPGFAFQTAITTLVGQALGAEKPKLAEKFTYYTIGIGFGILAVASVLLYIFANQVIGLFTPDGEVIELAVMALRINCLFQPIACIAWIIAGALRGAGDVKWNFYITAFTDWSIRALGSIIFIRFLGFGLEAAAWFGAAGFVARTLLLFLRFRTGKWKTRLTAVNN